jgi:type IV secretory pathway VirB2 component (pilin)
MKRLAPILLLLLLLVTLTSSLVLAEIDFDSELSEEEEALVDEILEPVMKIYNFIKYAATVLAVMMLVFAGITFVTAGGDSGQKEKAKNMAVGVVIGLIIIWVAPVVVEFIFS